MSKLSIFFDHKADKEIQKNNNELTYPFKKSFSYKVATLIPVAAMCASSFGLHAATLEERAVYKMKILVAGDSAQIGQCSAFTFGDISVAGCPKGGLEDNTNTAALTDTLGGNGVLGDGLGGIITIETAKADSSGNNTFTVTDYQVDPYLKTAGGTFKTTMTAPSVTLPALSNGKVQVAAVNNGKGTLTATGEMTLDLDGRTGIAGAFATSIGYQDWNHDNNTKPNITIKTGVNVPFTTGNSSNYLKIDGSVNLTLTGRPIADTAPTDGVLDAVLVSAGNVGSAWTGFDGTLYTEGYNVQFELVSAKPLAKDDALTAPVFATPQPVTITISTDLLANDTHAKGDTLSLSTVNPLSATLHAANGSTIKDNGDGTLTYSPVTSGTFATDSFDYTIEDASGYTDTATMTLSFPSGTAPVAVADNLSTDEDKSIMLNPVDNDTDADPDTLILDSFDGISEKLGTVTAASGNSVTYTPAANFFGTDTFNYKVDDQHGNLVTGKVTVTVNSVNDPLICEDVKVSTTTDKSLSVNINTALLSTCTDIDTADTLAFTSVQTPTDGGGNISNDGAGTLTYTPALGYSGTDTFTYTANDGTVDDTPRTVTVTVGKFGNFTMLLKGTGDTFGGTNDVIFEWDQTTNTDTVDYTNNLNFNMKITSSGPEPFFGAVWIAHSVRVFGPGTYSFDSGCTTQEITTTGCPADSVGDIDGKPTPNVTMTVGPNQVGAHILFDYNGSFNIDVLNVWDKDAVWDDPDGDASDKNNLFDGAAGIAPDPAATWGLVSRDVDGDGINGMPMVDGPFIGYSANFSDAPSGTATPPPGGTEAVTVAVADTKLGSGGGVGALGLAWLLGMLPAISFFRRRFRKEQ